MNAKEFQQKIDQASALIVSQIPKAESESDAQLARLMGLGIQIFGEFLTDVKRLADAADLANRIQAQRFDFKAED